MDIYAMLSLFNIMEIEEIEKIPIENLSDRDVEIIDFMFDFLSVNKKGKIDMTKFLLTPKGKGYSSKKIFN